MTAPRDSQWPVTQPSEAGEHNYLSTACHHEIGALAAGEIERAAELHAYCSANSGKAGAKRPGHCKWCEAKCACPRHEAGAVPVAWAVGAAETERALRERYADVVTPEVMQQLRGKLGLGAVLDGEVLSVREMQEQVERRPQMPDVYRAFMRAGQADLHRYLQEAYRDKFHTLDRPAPTDEPSGVYPRPNPGWVTEAAAQWWRNRVEDEAFRLRKDREQPQVFGGRGVDEGLGRRMDGEA